MSVLENLVVRLLGDAAGALKAFAEVESGLQGVVKAAESAGKTLSVALTAPLTAIGLGSRSAAVGFEHDMAKIEGLVGVAKDQVQAWGKQILELAPQLGRMPEELAKALYFITSGGLRGQKAIDALTVSAKAATAGLGETKVIANAVKSAMIAYTKQGLTSAQATDMMVAAIREGKLEADALGSVIGRILPLSSAMGVSFADVAGTLAVMSRTGSTAAEAAVSIQAIITMLTKTGKEAEKSLSSVGLSSAGLRDVLKKPGGLIEVMRLLDVAFKGDIAAMQKVSPNVRSTRGLMNVLAQDAKFVSNIMDAVAHSTGATEKAFQIASKTGAVQMDMAMAQLKVTMIEVGDVVRQVTGRAIIFFSATLKSLTEAWRSLDAETQKAIVTFGAIAAAVGPVLLALVAASKVGIGGIASFAVPLVAGLAAAGAAAQAFKSNLGGIKDAVEGTWAFTNVVLKNFGSVVKGVAATAKEGFDAAAAAVQPFIQSVAQAGQFTSGLFANVVKNNRETIGTLTVLAASAAAAAIAFKVLAVAFTFTAGVMAALKVQQAVAAVLWVTWSAAVLAAKAVLFLFNVQVVIWKSLMTGAALVQAVGTLAMLAFGAAALVAKVSLLGVVASLLALVGTFAIVSTATAVVAGALVGVWSAARAAFDGLSLLGTIATGPIAAVSALFREWGSILKEVAETAKTDMAGAWEILRAGANLAVLQVKALWSPLWTFISEGFEALWKLVWAQFDIHSKQATKTVKFNIISWLAGFLPKRHKWIQDVEDQWAKDADKAEEASQKAVEKAEEAFKKAAGNFKPTLDSKEIKDARKALEDASAGAKIDAFMKNLMTVEPHAVAKAAATAAAAGKEIGGAMGGAMAKEVAHGRDAALRFSVEGLSRIAEYAQRLREQQGTLIPTDRPRAPAAPAVEDGWWKRNVGDPAPGKLPMEVLKQIRDALIEAGKKPTIAVADSGITA